MRIHIKNCQRDEILPLIPVTGQLKVSVEGHVAGENTVSALQALQNLPVGTRLLSADKAIFIVVGRILQACDGLHARHCPLLQALQDLPEQEITLHTERTGYALAWVTLSDKGSVGLREDASGPCIGDMLREKLPLCHEQGFILPDDPLALRTLMLELSMGQGYDIICTTGGTGLTERDLTPEAMAPILDARLHGFEHAMMQESLTKTPHAMLSRAMVGIIKTNFGASLCVNLPGSVKAVQENLMPILPALPHALKKLQGDTSDCSR